MNTPAPAQAPPSPACRSERMRALAEEHHGRIDRLLDRAWRSLASDGSTVASREVSRSALVQVGRLSRDLRRAASVSSPEPAWVACARNRLLLLRMEVGELAHHHRADRR